MTMSLLRGNYTSDTQVTAPDTRVRFVDPRILFAQAAIAPITILAEKLKRVVRATAVKCEWVEKSLGTPSTTVNGAVAAGGTTINVATGTGVMFGNYDLAWIPSTGEQILVSSVSADALTVSRAFGSTSAAAIADGATIIPLSTAFAENATSGTGVAIQPSMPYNVTQIHRTCIDISRSESQVSRYDYKNRLADARREMLIIHREKVERANLVGELKWDTTNHRRAAKGILGFITTNVDDCDGTLTKAKLDRHLKNVMLNGGGEYWGFCSGTALEAINQEVLTNSNMQITPATKEWGLDIRKYMSPFGTINLVYHRIMSQVLEEKYGGCMLSLDMNRITKYYLQPLVLRENIQARDADGRKDEYLEECCLGVGNEDSHGFIYDM